MFSASENTKGAESTTLLHHYSMRLHRHGHELSFTHVARMFSREEDLAPGENNPWACP